VTNFQPQSATCDLSVGRLNDLGSVPDSLIAYSRVGIGQSALSGVQPGGYRRTALDGNSGAPALVEVPYGEDTVFLASLTESVLYLLRELRQPGWCDSRNRVAKTVKCQFRHRISGSSPWLCSAVMNTRRLSARASG